MEKAGSEAPALDWMKSNEGIYPSTIPLRLLTGAEVGGLALIVESSTLTRGQNIESILYHPPDNLVLDPKSKLRSTSARYLSTLKIRQTFPRGMIDKPKFAYPGGRSPAGSLFDSAG